MILETVGKEIIYAMAEFANLPEDVYGVKLGRWIRACEKYDRENADHSETRFCADENEIQFCDGNRTVARFFFERAVFPDE